MRVVGGNIRAGGGKRIEQVASQIWDWRPDIVALSEFRGTPPSEWLAAALADVGLPYQQTTASSELPARNALLVASRWPTSVIPLRALPHPRQRVLPVHVESPVPISIVAVHGPLGVTGLRRQFNSALLTKLRAWKRAPGMLIGDTNTGKRGVDEESSVFDARDDLWMDGMAEAGWPDAFRHLHGNRREYTWYSPNRGNGFRLDEAFIHRSLIPSVSTVEYHWAPGATGRRDAVSDHAAIVVDLA